MKILSICVTVKNRSIVKLENGGFVTPFQDFVRSLNKCKDKIPDFELVISDWQSTDYPIKEWIEDCLPDTDIHIVSIVSNGGFSAGLGRNIAASHAEGEIILFSDADMIWNATTINHGINSAQNGRAFYPVIKYEIEPNGKQIIHEGGGNVFLSKDNFKKTTGWPEYWKHGFEDVGFCKSIMDSGIELDTPKVNDESLTIFHPWHPKTWFGEDHKLDLVKEIYLKEKNTEFDSIKNQISLLIDDPNTTHSSLNRIKPPSGIIGSRL